MKRLGIFLTYDEEGIVDDYIVVLLEAMKKVLHQLVIVSNNSLTEESRNKLKRFSNDIYERENIGFDAGGFKDALINYIGWEKMRQYDELVLFNDSFFGPFWPMNEMFDKMQERELDFWALTKNLGKVSSDDALQSYFVVVRSKMLHSVCFRSYWENLPYFSSFRDTVMEYEMKFAQFFSEHGFKWDSYVSSERYEYKGESKYRMSMYHSSQYEIMKEQRYPVLKRKLFDLDASSYAYGLDRHSRENFLLALDYVCEETDYDMDLIWKNVLRTYSLKNIQDCCCMNRVVHYQEDVSGEYKVKVILWLEEQEISVQNIAKIFSQTAHENVIVGTASGVFAERLKENYPECEIKVFQNINSFLKFILDNYGEIIAGYDYLIFYPDYKCCATREFPYATDVSNVWNFWENLFGNKGYMNGVCHMFSDEPNLGMLVAPHPIHGNNIRRLTEKVEIDEFVTNVFGIEKYVSREGLIANWSEGFWLRTKLIEDELISGLKKIVEYYSEDKEMVCQVSQALPYFCQKKGYYTCTVETEQYASMYQKLLEVYLRTFLTSIRSRGGNINAVSITRLLKLRALNEIEIQKFVQNHERIFIYGCGEISELLSELEYIGEISGYIVSDGAKKNDEFNQRKVYSWSDIEFADGDGIIVAINDKYSEEIKSFVYEKRDDKDVLFLKNGGTF